MEYPIDSGESPLGFGVNAVVGLIVELEGTAFEDVFGFPNVWQRQFRQSRKIHLLDYSPRVFNLGEQNERGGRGENNEGDVEKSSGRGHREQLEG